MMNINDLIKNRRSIFPNTFVDKSIPKEVIQQILENANWAPTHRLTEPWRFKVFTGESLKSLSDFLGNWYQNNIPTEKYSERKHKKTIKKPMQCACVIAICMQRDPKESVPEWEEIAAVACAVQNMWLTCTANDIGCYWSSPAAIHSTKEFLNLNEGERCLGFLYMGYHESPKMESPRKSIDDKVVWR